jgi:four helix bundle protein
MKMENSEFKIMLIKRSIELAREVMKLVDNFPKKASARVISDQLLRSAMSVGANITEAQAASSKRDFINFLSHSLKSGNETKFWLVLTRDLDGNLIPEINRLIKEADEIVRILGSSISKLKEKI